MDDLNKLIFTMMATGKTQLEISEEFKRLGYTPNSVSIIEKRIKKVKIEYRAKSIFHLAIILTKKGFI